MFPILILFALANITFSMAVSTLFSDSKFSNQLGGVLLFLPIGVYLYLVSTGINTEAGVGKLQSDLYWVVYFIYWIPIIPACSLLINLSDPPSKCITV